MNLKVKQSVPSFLIEAQALFNALQKDCNTKGKMPQGCNITDQILDACFSSYARAQLAIGDYTNCTQDAGATKTIYEARHQEAVAVYRKHSALLQVALKYKPQKQLDLGIIGREEEKTSSKWIANTLQSYQLLLADLETMALLSQLNVSLQDIENGKTVIDEFNNAYSAMTTDRPQVKLAIDNRDVALRDLVDNVSYLQALLLQAFAKEPKQLKKYNLPLVNDEIGREISISMVKDSSIT